MRSQFKGGAVALVGLAASLVTLQCPAGATSADVKVDEVIDGIVARSEAIVAIRLDYEYHGVAQDGNGQELSSDDKHLRFTLQGNDWLLRYADSANFRLRRNQATVNYTEVIGDDGQPVRSLHVEAPETLRSLVFEHAAHAAPRLGTLWFPEQARFVGEHRHAVRRSSHERVDDIHTIMLEWEITSHDFGQAFLVLPEGIAKVRAGRLRIHAAPSLNYALPRIEYVDPAGDADLRIDARDFRLESGGIYFPRYAACVTQLAGGKDLSEFRIREVSWVNEDAPADEFSLKIPPMTRVRDSRPGVPTSVFSLQDQDQFDSVNQVLAGQTGNSTAWKLRRVAVVGNTVLVFSLLTLWMYRRCRSG